MQCGVPVITSDNSSIPEVVGDAGLMFLARDQNALIGGMMKVYCSIEMRELLKQKSLSQAKKFSWENTMDEFVVVLKKIINYE
jgi:glycosyltransferase involved in cell wall biosynthesis